MRAIINMKVSYRDTKEVENQLGVFLRRTGWLPVAPQDSPEILTKRAELIAMVSERDREFVESWAKFTIFDNEKKTWGIVTLATLHDLTFRLHNENATMLKESSERLVGDLQRSGEPLEFEFRGNIQIAEPMHDLGTLSGTVLPVGQVARLGLAIKEKQSESVVGLLAFLVAVISTIASFPLPSGTPQFAVWFSISPHLEEWLIGSIGRIATSATVAWAIGWIEVILHWLALRRKATIEWKF